MHLLACKYNYHNDVTFTDTPYFILRSLRHKYLLLTGQNPSQETSRRPVCPSALFTLVLGCWGRGEEQGFVQFGEEKEMRYFKNLNQHPLKLMKVSQKKVPQVLFRRAMGTKWTPSSWFVFNSLSGNPKGPVPAEVSAAGDLGQDRNGGWINVQRSVCTAQHYIHCSAGISTAKSF